MSCIQVRNLHNSSLERTEESELFLHYAEYVMCVVALQSSEMEKIEVPTVDEVNELWRY